MTTRMSHFNPRCRHPNQVQMGEYTVYPFSGERDPIPPVDIILDLYGLGETVWPEFNGMIISHPICDGGAPTGPIHSTIDHMRQLIEKGMKVGVCCYGGHGRTGTVLCALMHHLQPEAEDLIATLRLRYCDKAVETNSQEDWIAGYSGKPNFQHLGRDRGYHLYRYDEDDLWPDGSAETVAPILASNLETEEWLVGNDYGQCDHCGKWIPESAIHLDFKENQSCLFPQDCAGFEAILPRTKN